MHAQRFTYQTSTHLQEALFFSDPIHGKEKTEDKYSIDDYRYGFNGMEKDDEVNNSEGTSYTAEFWKYDSRIGRR